MRWAARQKRGVKSLNLILKALPSLLFRGHLHRMNAVAVCMIHFRSADIAFLPREFAAIQAAIACAGLVDENMSGASQRSNLNLAVVGPMLGKISRPKTTKEGHLLL